MLNEERSFSSLEEVTKLLIAAEGKTFRELDETGRGDSVGNKGSLGNIIEESVLHYPVNSDAEADILVGDTRYELKVTPLKHSGKGKRTKTVAKERLVLDIINYENLPKENFEDSRFWNKSKNIIMVYYYDDREDKKTQSRLDCKVLKSVVLHYDENDLATIRDDWETDSRESCLGACRSAFGIGHKLSCRVHEGCECFQYERCSRASRLW